jgi:hypothetical protein
MEGCGRRKHLMGTEGNTLRHPGEDLLAAFAEGSLTRHERQQVLEHLASCFRCRELVFLAQESVAQESAGPIPAPDKSRTRWFVWKPAWILAGVVLVLAAVAPFVLLRQKHETHIASARTDASLPSPSAGASSRAGKPGSPVSQQQTVKKSHHHVQSVLSKEQEKQLPPAASATEAPVEQQNAAANTTAMSLLSGTAPAGKASRPIEESAVKPTTQPVMMSPAPVLEPVPTQTSQMIQMRSRFAQPFTPLPANFRIQNGMVESCHGGVCKPRPLPSAVHAVSTAFYGNTVMALDVDGNLFISHDQGAHWMQQAKQWAGKAESIRLVIAGNTQPIRGNIPNSLNMGVPESRMAPVFALTTSDGALWTSPDRGATWNKQ